MDAAGNERGHQAEQCKASGAEKCRAVANRVADPGANGCGEGDEHDQPSRRANLRTGIHESCGNALLRGRNALRRRADNAHLDLAQAVPHEQPTQEDTHQRADGESSLHGFVQSKEQQADPRGSQQRVARIERSRAA